MTINRNRRSNRLKDYDYASPGAYFITLVTWRRDEIFGNVVNGVKELSPLGKIAHDEWFRSASTRREICLNEDEFIIMPNHLHCIVWIVDSVNIGVNSIRPDYDVCTNRGASLAPLQTKHDTNLAPLYIPLRKPRSLSSFVAGYKASVTSRAKHELEMTGIWQRNYYDHIIRNNDELSKIWDYIDTNPQKWHDDELYKSGDK